MSYYRDLAVVSGLLAERAYATSRSTRTHDLMATAGGEGYADSGGLMREMVEKPAVEALQIELGRKTVTADSEIYDPRALNDAVRDGAEDMGSGSGGVGSDEGGGGGAGGNNEIDRSQ